MKGSLSKTASLLAAGTIAVGGLGALAQRTWAGEGSAPLDPPRYETLRALAEHLDVTAQGALEGALDDAQHATSLEPSFLASIRSFARRAHDFRAAIDKHGTPEAELPARVGEITTLARDVSDRIRSAHALESTYDEWEAILDVLGRMKVLLAGGDVEVPAPHVVAALSGPALEEFRKLAHDLEVTATRAHATAKHERGRYPDRGEQFLGELEYFAAQSRDLHRQADGGEVRPQIVGPIVDHVLEDARQADRQMRDARVFTSVWDDSGRIITILQRMATLVRS